MHNFLASGCLHQYLPTILLSISFQAKSERLVNCGDWETAFPIRLWTECFSIGLSRHKAILMSGKLFQIQLPSFEK